ncbi:MAG: response regulator [Bacteroidota bacterium]
MANTVYILEDEAVITLILKRYLHKNGFQVVGEADTTRQAKAQISELQPDILLVDIFLAENSNGIELIQSLEKPRPHFIFLTGNSDEATRSKARALDPAGYLVKPIDMKQLIKLLNQLS